MNPSLRALLDAHVASSVDKQSHLSDLVGNSNWELDTVEGVLSIGRFSWHVQILGTQSDRSQTWMWAWANRSLSPGALRAAEAVREFGRRNGVPEFTQATLLVQEGVDGHGLSTIASGVVNAMAYYRGPYDGGAVFVGWARFCMSC